MFKNTFIAVNFGLAFLLELAALVAIGAWGFKTGTGINSWLLGLGIPVAAAVMWGMFAAPNAAYDVPWMAVAVKVAVFGGAAVALFVAISPRLAIIYSVVLVLNLIIVHLPGFADHFDRMMAQPKVLTTV